MDCWLARDGFGMLQLHHSKPFWDDKKEDWISGLKIGILSSLDFEFKDVTFENSPVKVEINLKNSKNMENKKINVAELLKDCPKGMELDCTLYDDVKFMEVDAEREYIMLQIGNEFIKSLNKYGQQDSFDFAKCVIFPKGKTTWEGFVPPVTVEFKDGDILVTGKGRENERVTIFKSDRGNNSFNYHALVYLHTTKKVFKKDDWAAYINVRFATEEEKGELFKAIKENGYRWNSETKTLEELPKFKDGDIVCTTLNSIAIIKGVSNKNYCSTYCGIVCNDYFNIGVMVLPKRLATEEEKQRLFKAIKENGYNWNAETKTLELEKLPNKFDTSSLIPYESKVLVRNSLDGYWKPAFWGKYAPENPERHQNRNFLTTLGFTRYCIPFEGNEALTGTANDCNEFYKIWEE